MKKEKREKRGQREKEEKKKTTTTIMMTTTRITETKIRNKLSLPLIKWFIEKERVFE